MYSLNFALSPKYISFSSAPSLRRCL